VFKCVAQYVKWLWNTNFGEIIAQRILLFTC
jgi:hypothetical protein